jgi:hypothetical protein
VGEGLDLLEVNASAISLSPVDLEESSIFFNFQKLLHV